MYLLLMLFEEGATHFALFLLTLLLLKYKEFKEDENYDSNDSSIEESILLKNKSKIIKQAYKDSGIYSPVFVSYPEFKLSKLNLIKQKELENHVLNGNEVYLITDSKKNEVSHCNWDFYMEKIKYKVSFEEKDTPYFGDLNSQLIVAFKDALLAKKNKNKSLNMANVSLLFSRKCVVEVFGNILDVSDNQIYAIASHEAMHAKYFHSLIGSFISTESLYISFRMINYLLSFFCEPIALPGALMGMIFFTAYLKMIVSRQLEKFADIMAAKELGVGKDLLDYLQSSHDEDISFSHPSHKERIQYLLPYSQRYSLFRGEEKDENLPMLNAKIMRIGNFVQK